MTTMRSLTIIIICMISASLVTGCGRRTRKPVEIKDKPESIDAGGQKGGKTKLLKVELEGVHDADLAQTWITWNLRCGVNTYPGSTLSGETVVGFLLPTDEFGPCTLRADGTPPAEWADKFKSEDGLLYSADVEDLSVGYVNVTATKHYKGPGADPKPVLEEDDLEISTTDGGKCQEFDTETFKCIR